jgi:hypothetical protein
MKLMPRIIFALFIAQLAALSSAQAQVCGTLTSCPSASVVNDADLLYLVQDGVSKKVTASILLGSAPAASLEIGATITGGTDKLVLFQNETALDQNANFSFNIATGVLASPALAISGNVVTGGIVAFGDTTSSSPSLRRSSAKLQVRLADNSGYAGLEAANLALGGATLGSFTLAVTGTSTFNGPISQTIPDSNQNLVIGTGALPSPTGAGGASNNVALGQGGVLAACVTCDSTVAIGFEAGQSWIDGRSSTFVGHVAGQWAIGGSSNTFIGAFSGRGGSGVAASPALTGVDNTCLGEASCINIHGTASFNTAIGFNAAYGLATGSANTLYGQGAGQSLVDTDGNVVIGQNAYQFGMGSNNVIIGRSAGVGTSPSTTVTSVSSAGTATLFFTDTTIYHVGDTVFLCCAQVGSTIVSVNPNVSITISTLLFGDVPVGASVYDIAVPHTGSNAVIIGYNAASSIQGTVATTAVGVNALQNLTTGSNNAAFGRGTLTAITTQTSNSAFGLFAGANVTSVNNTFMGSGAGEGSTGSPNTGGSNSSFGKDTLLNIAGAASSNTAVGATTSTAITTASQTTAVGAQALKAHLTGTGSVAMGFQSLDADASGTGNIGVGYQTGSAIVSGSFNLIMGYSVASVTLSTGSNNIIMGTAANCDADASSTASQFKVCSTTGSTPLMKGNLLAASLSLTVNGSFTLPSSNALSSSTFLISGAPITGGTSTTTKPLALIETAGATTTIWNTAGTMLGVNAPSAFAGDLLSVWLNGVARFSVSSAGVVTISSNVVAGAGSSYQWSGRSLVSSPADGEMNVTNNAATAGVGFDFATDAVLKIRTTAQTGYATIDALGYKAGGVAGISAVCSVAPTGVTYTGGIVTALVGGTCV